MKWLPPVCGVGALLILAMAAVTLNEVSGLRRGIMPIEESALDEKSASWVDADCITRSVKTARKAGETDDEFCARHDAAVARDMQIYGVKPPNDEAPEGGVWLSWYLERNPKALIEDTPWR